MVAALVYAQESMKGVLEIQKKITEEIGKEKI